jgi:hypothetical protein
VELQKLIAATARQMGVSVSLVADGALGPATYSAFRKVVGSDRFPWSALPYDLWFKVKQDTESSVQLAQNADAAMQALRAAGVILIAKGVVSNQQPSVRTDPPIRRAPVRTEIASQVVTVEPAIAPPSMSIGKLPGWAYAAGLAGAMALVGAIVVARKGK